MKAHIGVDMGSEVAHNAAATTASVHDSVKADALLHGDEQAIVGDKGYFDEGKKRAARKAGVWRGVLDRARRGRPLGRKQKRRNKKIARVRAQVEHPFQVIKTQWGHGKVRDRGIAKNAAQLHLLFALVNLRRCRSALLAAP